MSLNPFTQLAMIRTMLQKPIEGFHIVQWKKILKQTYFLPLSSEVFRVG